MMDAVADEDIKAAEASRREAERALLDEVFVAMSGKRDEWVKHRAGSGIEARWRLAEALYDGSEAGRETWLEETLRTGPGKRARHNDRQRRSSVVVNIVAPKVETVTSRLCEILLPVDDRNWGIKPTPDPKLAEALRETGVLVDPRTGQEFGQLSEAARAAAQKAKKAAEHMQRVIDDDLTECGYNGELRKVIADMVKLGTGVIKGPRPVRSRASRFDMSAGAGVKQIVDTVRRGSVRVSPWNIYPDPACGTDHQRGSGIWERGDITRRELRDLMGLPGYLQEAIAEVLAEEPKAVSCSDGKVGRATKTGSYEMWEYHGEIEAKDFQFLRMKAGIEGAEQALADAEGVERVLLVMVNDRVIGALPHWCDEDLPYDVVQYTERDDGPWGDGLPHRLESQQRVVTSAWRQLMDNSGLASGAQLAMLRGVVEPADGDWQLSPMKIWLARDDFDDIRKAISVFEISSHVEELLAIVDAAMRLADQESNVPLLMQGDQGAAPDNVGGTTMLFQAANSPLRHRVKRVDDKVTRPHIRRYYSAAMADPAVPPEAKGDFEVDARGSSVLIERDAQQLAVMNMVNLSASPVYGPLIQMRAAQSLRSIVKAQRLPVEDWVPEDDEIDGAQQQAAQDQQPQDPKIVAAQIAAQSKSEEIADRKEERAFRAQIEAQNSDERRASLAYNAQREQSEYAIAMTQEQNERYLALLKLQQDRELSERERQLKEALEVLRINADRQMFNAEAQLKTRMGSGI